MKKRDLERHLAAEGCRLAREGMGPRSAAGGSPGRFAASYHGVVATDRERRLREAAAEAKAANAAGDIWAAQAAWDRYQLIRDSECPPDERLEEAISLSRQVEEISRSRR